MKILGYKYTIIIGLLLQAVQLFIYGIWTTPLLMWGAGLLAALASIIYPAISALVSKNAEPEQQGEGVGKTTPTIVTSSSHLGVVLGILTGMRGLCMGLGPALFGLFYLSHIHLDTELTLPATPTSTHPLISPSNTTNSIIQVSPVSLLLSCWSFSPPLGRSLQRTAIFVWCVASVAGAVCGPVHQRGGQAVRE